MWKSQCPLSNQKLLGMQKSGKCELLLGEKIISRNTPGNDRYDRNSRQGY